VKVTELIDLCIWNIKRRWDFTNYFCRGFGCQNIYL